MRLTTKALDTRIAIIRRAAAAQGHPYATMERYSAYGMHGLAYGDGAKRVGNLNTLRETYYMAGAILATLEENEK